MSSIIQHQRSETEKVKQTEEVKAHKKRERETHMLDRTKRDTPLPRPHMKPLYPPPNRPLQIRRLARELCELRIILLQRRVVRVLQRTRVQGADLRGDGAVGCYLLVYFAELWVGSREG